MLPYGMDVLGLVTRGLGLGFGAVLLEQQQLVLILDAAICHGCFVIGNKRVRVRVRVWSGNFGAAAACSDSRCCHMPWMLCDW
jgi:hypothetical protein